MIRSLQKRHLWTWGVLAFILPVGFIAAYLSVPDYPIENYEITIKPEVFPEVERSKLEQGFEIQLKTRNGTALKQVEIRIRQPLTSPAVVVYAGFPEGKFEKEKAQLLGALGTKGIYRFNLNEELSAGKEVDLFFYDLIKKVVVHQILI